MQTLPFDQVLHRIVARNGQPVVPAIKRINQVEENLGPEVGRFDLFDGFD